MTIQPCKTTIPLCLEKSDLEIRTLEECLGDCAGYTYFGVEYGGECLLFFYITRDYQLTLSRLLRQRY